jgi:hypothetical protein
MRCFTQYFTILLVSLYCLVGNAELSFADVCVSDQEAVDIITLLDASERDIAVLGSCEKLVQDLYAQLDLRDEKIVRITTDLIGAKQEAIKYKNSAVKWRRVAIYSSVTGAIILLIQLVPVL